MSRSTILMTAVVLALSFSGAYAADNPPIVVVNDLNLSLPKDAQRLYDRIYAAAQAVCGGGALTTFGQFPNTDFMACRDAAIDAALSKFHSPLVLAFRKGSEMNGKLAAAAPSAPAQP